MFYLAPLTGTYFNSLELLCSCLNERKMLIKLKKNTLWSIFWEAPQQVSKEGVGESEFLAAIAMATNRWNVNKDERPNIKVCTTDITSENFNLPEFLLLNLMHSSPFHDGGRYHTVTSPLICRANKWTGFYMITTSVMKGLSKLMLVSQNVRLISLAIMCCSGLQLFILYFYNIR